MSSIFSLNKEMTAYSIFNRRVFRIRCCGDMLEQRTVFSLLPTDEVDCSRSLIILYCPRCNRELDVEIINSILSAERESKIQEILSKS